jgi:predicted ATPase/class 3 adenylate cyclase
MAELPSGTVTFLFTDIQGSTRLWEEHPDAMRAALAQHDALIRGAVEAHRGYVVKTTGDGVHAAFAIADDGIRAAIVAQRVLAAHEWGETGRLRVRMGLHTGAAEVRNGDYYGSPLNRAARLTGVAHGGQILCSQATADLARDSLAEGVVFTDLGDHRLRDLSRPERVFQVHAADLDASFGPLRSLDSFPGNLPVQVSSFVGRERELARTVEALRDARVVTLTGVGGVGKTRLALQVAAEVLPQYREGAWLVELAPVRDPDDVVDAFAAAFGVSAGAGLTLEEALVEFLGTKQLLLVVDNCEHLLDAVAELIEEICHTCPGVRALATSREGLALDGERVVPVPSLPGPPADATFDVTAQADAVRLFVDRANSVDPDFVLNAANVSAVAQVCRRLDGVALAIELAAARVSAMNPAELASALDRRFDVLAGGRRRAVKRHQTLRATIDWSYDLLDEAQRRLLARLAVFAGGCSREAVEAVCAGEPIDAGAVFELLAGLVARSLVVADRGGLDTRYRLLETIREYGEERLIEHDETGPLRDRHARYYADYALRCSKGLWTPQQLEWGTRINVDGDNILAAYAHAVDTHDFGLAIKFLEATSLLNMSGAQIGLFVSLPVEQLLSMSGLEQQPGYPLVLMAAAFVADARGEAALARQYGDAALDAERAATIPRPYTTDLCAARLHLLGLVALSTGEWDDAAAAFLEAADLDRRTNPGRLAATLGSAASAMCYGGRLADATPLAAEGLALARTTGIPMPISTNLVSLAQALSRQDPEQARALLDEASDTDLKFENFARLTQMTLAAAMISDWPLTARLATRSIPHLHWMNQRPYLQAVLTVVARALADTDPEAAATIQGAAHTLAAAAATTATADTDHTNATTREANRGGIIIDTRRDTTRVLVEVLGDERLRHLRGDGAAMDTDAAVAYTLSRLNTFLRSTT